MASWTNYSRAQLPSLVTRVEIDGEAGQNVVHSWQPSRCRAPGHMDLVDMRYQLVDAVGQPEVWKRLAATFYFYEGLTLKEIGKALELSEGCISQILRYAFTDLQEHLEWSILELNEFGGWRTFLS